MQSFWAIGQVLRGEREMRPWLKWVLRALRLRQ